jgi:RimJ/RimL family protein N-acetyltransferase
MEIRTERLALREPRPADAAALVAGCSDPDVPRFIPLVPSPYTEEDAQEFLREVARRWRENERERTFAVADAATDALLGTATVRLFEGGQVGYWLAREARGRGLATEAVRALVAWAYEQGVRHLTLTAHPENVASQRVAEKAGFVPIGLVPHEPPFRDGTAVAEAFELDTHAPTERLVRRIRRDFPDEADDIVERMAKLALPMAENQSRERILAATVLAARGDRSTLDWGMRMATRDWRDVLVGGGLANLDWPTRLDVELGPR